MGKGATENASEVMAQSSPAEVTSLLPCTEYQVFVASVTLAQDCIVAKQIQFL